MAKGRGKKEEAREDEGRGEASRRSRSMQGLPAEEHKDLDQLKRDRRAKLKAEREARAAQAEEPAVEPAAQDEQVSTKVEGEDAEVRSEAEVETAPEERVQACEPAEVSEEGAKVVESLATDEVSTSLLLGKEGRPSEEAESADQESKVEARPTLEDADASSRRSLSSPVPPDTSSQAAQGSEHEASRTSDASTDVLACKTLDADLRSELHAETQNVQFAGEDASNFVARQVYRWEQMRSGRVTPPRVEYAWPVPLPDFTLWFRAAKATANYLHDRMSMEDQYEACITKLCPERAGFWLR
jgi:hypothetical protein